MFCMGINTPTKTRTPLYYKSFIFTILYICQTFPMYNCMHTGKLVHKMPISVCFVLFIFLIVKPSKQVSDCRDQ